MSEQVRVASGASPVFEIPDIGHEPVFLVDDDPSVLAGMERYLTRVGYAVECFGTAADALARVGDEPPKVLVTDNHMPGMTGLELAERALEIDSEIRVILVTGQGDEATAQAALRLGAADYLVKPVDTSELARAVQKGFVAHALGDYTHEMDQWLRGEVSRQTEVIRSVTLATLSSLLNALEARSPHFKGHSQNVAVCAAGIARELDLPVTLVNTIRTAGLLHDIGMIAVPDSVVNKPGRLSREEYQSIVTHCRKGADILEPMEHIGPAVRFVMEHHERLDGSGYPDGKKGDEISLGGQILGLAEAWTALTEERPYRDSMSASDAMATLVGASGAWFAQELLEALRASES